ncbi:MAG: folate family ECF transporter S component [Tissierellia bacterium]|nr:folate family ECF transporter S component [Tissierellia bacterium]
MKKYKTFRVSFIVYCALLIALNVVLTRVGSIRIGGGGVEIVRIGFGGYPIIFAGIMFGPLAGGIVGAIGDIIGMIISPMGPYMPHFTISAALTGIIPGYIMRSCASKECKTSTKRLMIAIGIGQIVTSIILVPYFMKVLFGVPFAVSLPSRLISQAITIPIYVYMTKILINRLYFVVGVNR